jgi:rhodanese-related sulfurtransferase
MQHSEGFLRIVGDAKSRVKETDIAGADEILKNDPEALLVDVREDDEWRKEHVKGAIHIGKGVIERDIEKLIPQKDRLLLLYCGGGYRSALAADVLQRMGYTNVWSVDGGFRACKEAGKEMECGDDRSS